MKAYRTDARIHHIHSFFSFSFWYFLVPCGKFRPPYPGKAQLPQEWRYPFLSVRVVCSCIQTTVWLPVFGTFNACTDVDACDCAWGLYGHRKRVCTEFQLWEENPSPHQGHAPTSELCLTLYQLRYPRPSYMHACMCTHTHTQQKKL